MADPTIRPATPADVAGIRRVARQGWTAAYEGILSESVIDRAMAEWYDPDTLAESIDREAGTYLDAEGEEIVGYASGDSDGGDDDRVAELGAIYVDPDRWGEGVGTALLSAFERERRRAGNDIVRLRVLADNEIGIAFYRARGYDPVADRESELFGQEVSERVFRRDLE